MPVRVLIAEHDAVYRAGLHALLEKEPEILIVGEVGDGTSVIKERRLWETEVLLLDAGLPGSPSPKGLIRTLQESPKTHILIIATNESQWFAQECLKAGARGCILKQSIEAELIRAIQVVAADRYYVDHELVGHGVSASYSGELGDNSDEMQTPQLDLSEQDVCRLLVCGFTHSEIAERLDMAQSAVEAHRHAIMTKLGLQSRADLVQFALTHKHLGPW